MADGTGLLRFLGETVEFFLLANIGREGYDFRAVSFLDPADDDGGVEASGICEYYFHGLWWEMVVDQVWRRPRTERIAFWTCMRFSAWSQTTEDWPSMISSVTSLPM